MYKVCSREKLCSAHNTLGAFDDAIADGVDIITISVSFTAIRDFDEDPIAIGAFHAMEKGILTSNSAGNNGPSGATVSSVAPWMLTVAASSMDRRIIDKVVLGDGRTLVVRTVDLLLKIKYLKINLYISYVMYFSMVFTQTGELCQHFRIKWNKLSSDTWKRCFKELHRKKCRVILIPLSFF